MNVCWRTMVAVNAGCWERGLLSTMVAVNASRCGASPFETIAARCQGVRGVDELDVHVFAKGCDKVVDVNVEKAAGDCELRGLLEPRELRRT